MSLPVAKKATIVTCFYPIRSKFPSTTYMTWAQQFMKLESPIVLFTTAELAPLFREMRGSKPLHIIDRPFEEIDSWILYEPLWKAQTAHDPEADIHSPELYAIWACKPFFVSEAIDRNPFFTEKFFWCDIGVFREHVADQVFQNFPLADKLPSGRILLNSVYPLKPEENIRRSDGIIGDFLRADRLVGGLWGGDARGCKQWLAAYETMLIRYFVTPGRFAGKDQSVMLSAYLENPALASVAKCNSAGNPWFHFTRLLSDPSMPILLDETYVVNDPFQGRPRLGVRIHGGLGNQIFQIAAGYAHARSQNTYFELERYKRNYDRRQTYWDSMLYRFQHLLKDDYIQEERRLFYSDYSSTSYIPIPAVPDNDMYMHGFFQTGKYFANMHQEIIHLMRPPPSAIRFVRRHYSDLIAAKDRVVVVHCRRTDYLNSPWNISFHGPLPIHYYNESMRRMKTYIQDPIFLLCGDDTSFWVTNQTELVHLTDGNHFIMSSDETDIHTMALLSQFNHFIIANSTFSWWAATISGASRVIAPAQWFGPKGPQEYEDVFDPSWIRVDARP